MVSLRCKMIVRTICESMHLNIIHLELGEVMVSEDLSPVQQKDFGEALKAYGLELLEDRKAIIIEKIKTIIIEVIHYSEEPLLVNFSIYLSQRLNYEYNYLSNL